MNRGRMTWLVGFAAFGLWSSAATAANIQGPRRSAFDQLEEGDAIRERLLLRGGRFEITPTMGFTLNDAFRRNALVGVHVGYHFSDSVAVGLTGFYGLAFDSDLSDQIASNQGERGRDKGEFSDLKTVVSLDLIYTPLTGKFAAFGRSVFNYDIHAIVGLGGVSVSGSTKLEGFTPAPVIGLGMRTFIGQGLAFNIEIRDYIFSSSLNEIREVDTTGKAASVTDEAFSNNFAVTMGVALYFPQEAKLSK